MPPAAPRYRERLLPPPGWWLLCLGLILSVAVAFLFYLGPAWALATAVGTAAVAGAVLAAAATRIEVDATAVRVGRGVLELDYVAACRPLDADAATRRAGPQADARAHLVLRPYVATAVEIELDDPADPVPYWLVSTRHPDRLSAAVDACRTESDSAGPGRG